MCQNKPPETNSKQSMGPRDELFYEVFLLFVSTRKEFFKFNCSSEIGLVFELNNVNTDSSAWECGLRLE